MSETTSNSGRKLATGDELRALSDQLERAGTLLLQLAENGRNGQPPTQQSLSAAIILVLNTRGRLFGATRHEREGSARSRILHYLQAHEGEIVSADELTEVAGIRAWARRIRELREEGHDIEHVGEGRYRLNAA